MERGRESAARVQCVQATKDQDLQGMQVGIQNTYTDRKLEAAHERGNLQSQPSVASASKHTDKHTESFGRQTNPLRSLTTNSEPANSKHEIENLEKVQILKKRGSPILQLFMA